MRLLELGKGLEVLNEEVLLSISGDELRIIIGCLKALAYQAEVEDEPYIDADGRALQRKMELP